MRNGILAGGNYIIDYVKLINSYPEQDMLAQSRQSWLIYMSKRAQRCRVHYADGRGGTAVAEGELSVSLRDAGRLLISGHPEEIPLERVIVFEPLDEYV